MEPEKMEDAQSSVSPASTETNDKVHQESPTIPKPSRKRKLKQTTIATVQLGSSDLFNNPAEKVLVDLTTVAATEESLPKWMLNLLTYFKFVGNDKKSADNRTVYNLVCYKCLEIKSDTLTQKGISGKCASPFLRHLQMRHPLDHKDYLESCEPNQDGTTPKIDGFLTSSTLSQNNKYPKSHYKQRGFETSLRRMIVLDGLAFSVVEGQGFKALISSLDDKLVIPHRTTVERQLSKEFQKMRELSKFSYDKLLSKSCHLIIDIWTSRQNEPVLGIKVQYIHDWELRSATLGFQHFPESHTGTNIKKTMEKFLTEDLHFDPEKIGSITADNASNVLAAFKLHENIKFNALEEEEQERDVELNCMDGEIPDLDKDLEEEILRESEDLDNLIDSPIMDALSSFSNQVFRRNGCLAHLLQLAIKDAIVSNITVKSVTKKVTEIVTFFHRSPKWSSKLKDLTNGLSLIRPCATRWNSLHSSLSRVLTVDKVNVRLCINSVLHEAKTTSGSRCKFPNSLNDMDVSALVAIRELLEPLAVLTDQYQSDSITSSTVIPQFIYSVKRIQSYEVGSENPYEQEMTSFKNQLLQSVVSRFTSNKVRGDKVIGENGKVRRIVTVDVFNEKGFVLASLLDPRIKTSIFEAKVTEDTLLSGKLPRKEEAVDALKNEMIDVKKDLSAKKIAESGASVQRNTERDTQASGDWMDLLNSANVTDGSDDTSGNQSYDELAEYLKTPVLKGIGKRNSVLEFWKENHGRFPILSTIAQRYLGMPASSGSVERLFSIAGAIARSRRARTKIETVEQLLCLKDRYLQMK